MTKRYPGGYITKTPPTVSTTSAPGIWTMEQQAAYQKTGTWPFGGPFNYIEDVFSTYLYTGTGTNQTITNGIDLAGKGGLVWTKGRDYAFNPWLIDTERGKYYYLRGNQPDPQGTATGGGGAITSFNTDGYGVNLYDENNSPSKTFVSWTFRKQPKFFDVVTYTGDGAATRTISHNLGSTPGFVIIKNMDQSGNWMCWHNSFAATDYIALNTTGAKNYAGTYTDIYKGVSSTTVTIGSNAVVNNSGYNYVMYVFAHNAGGFGSSNSENVISCGSFTTDASGYAAVDLGYEPQWILTKTASSAQSWYIQDNMRGYPVRSANSPYLVANTSDVEVNGSPCLTYPTATGFVFDQNISVFNSKTFIYIAIRRGPMKTPTSGTSVFEPALYTGNGATSRTFTSSTVSPIDSVISMQRGGGGNIWWIDRLRGSAVIRTQYTDAEDTGSEALSFAYQNGYSNNYSASAFGWNNNTALNENYFFKRAPGFFDEVCYAGDGAVGGITLNHNLGVAPELVIIKCRNFSGDWTVYAAPLGITKTVWLDLTDAATVFSTMGSAPTATTIQVVNQDASGNTYVAYLFASCPGVSKVGSYTGTGTTLQIDCGFTGGARFVLIKRTDSTGDWYYWDSARGIVAGNDPYLLMNTSAAEVTNTDYVDAYAAGFEISSTAPAAINANGGTFIFLAIA